jgi:hypothetical protein
LRIVLVGARQHPDSPARQAVELERELPAARQQQREPLRQVLRDVELFLQLACFAPEQLAGATPRGMRKRSAEMLPLAESERLRRALARERER